MEYWDYLHIYVDGSSKLKPRRGGIGIRFVLPSGLEKDILVPGYKQSVVGEMEIKACVVALQTAIRLDEVKNGEIGGIIIYSDSEYVVNCYKLALYGFWVEKKWRKADGSPVLNIELWIDLKRIINRLYRNFRIGVIIEKVSAHAGVKGNVAADRLARKSAEIPFNQPERKFIVRRKKTKEETEPGSICAKGQRIKIRIVDALWFTKQKEFRLRCEVTSKKSEYFGKISFIYSKTSLRPGHEYLVSLNKNQDYPQINNVIKKIK